MDSLLQTYASSEEEDEKEIQEDHRSPISSKPSNFTFSLPPPKSHLSINPSATRLFSSLPEPQSAQSTLDTDKQSVPFLRSNKRLVQFNPPVFNPPSSIHDDDYDDEDDELAKRHKQSQSFSTQAPSVSSFLSSIPAPKNSRANLGSVLSSGSGRRSAIDTDVSIPPIPTLTVDNQSSVTYSNDGSTSAAYGAMDGESGSVLHGDDPSSWTEGYENYESYGGGSSSSIEIGAQGNQNYEGYGGSVEQYQYENSLFDGPVATGLPEIPKSMMKSFKRGRSEIPTQIIEVKQDELMKNRPREDQVKLTGIAFGPSYQPVASAKGKPTKLHKRKHQIGSLYFDMKQKEMELSERRAKGFLTKAETHAKYGW